MLFFYGIFDTHSFTWSSFLSLFGSFFPLAMAVIYILDARPYMKNRTYLIISEAGLSFPKGKNSQAPLVEWADIAGFRVVEKRGRRFDAIQVMLSHPGKYLTQKESSKPGKLQLPVLIVGESIVGELPKILDILKTEHAKH